MGINIYSGQKVPEHLVKVAYNQKEVDEIIKYGHTIEEQKRFDEIERLAKERAENKK